VDGNDDDNGPKRRETRSLSLKVSFFLFPWFFSILNDLNRYYGRSKGTEGFSGGSDEDNGPKRCVLRRLGPRSVFFFSFLSCFSCTK
jgi:hypothetical protein